jgi:hypothetical protein
MSSSTTSSSSLPPSVLHKAAIREARKALESRIESTEGGLHALFRSDGELYEYRRCRQLDVPLAAAPRSLGVGAVTWAAITAVSKLPFAGLPGLLNSRASLSLSGGLLYFNAITAPSSSLSEICYLFALSSDSPAGSLLRSTYGTHAGRNDFYKRAESLANSSTSTKTTLSFAERVASLSEMIPGENKEREIKKRQKMTKTNVNETGEAWLSSESETVHSEDFDSGINTMFESDDRKEEGELEKVKEKNLKRNTHERKRENFNDHTLSSTSSSSSTSTKKRGSATLKPEMEWQIDWGFEKGEGEEDMLRRQTARQETRVTRGGGSGGSEGGEDEPSYMTRRRRREEIAMR